MLTQLKYHALTASAWWLKMHSRSIQPPGSCHPHGNIWIMTLPCARTPNLLKAAMNWSGHGTTHIRLSQLNTGQG